MELGKKTMIISMSSGLYIHNTKQMYIYITPEVDIRQKKTVLNRDTRKISEQ